jgi:hypothetical protein
MKPQPHVPYLVNAVAKSIGKANHGPLLEFPPFQDIMAVWLASNRCTAQVVETYQLTEPDPFHAARKRRLGAKLVQLIEDDDVSGLRNVIKAIQHLRENSPQLHDPLLAKVAQFFRRHSSERWTLSEIQKCLRKETGAIVEDKTLRRWCKQHRFPIAQGKKTGRPRK